MNAFKRRWLLLVVSVACLIGLPGMPAPAHAALVQTLDYSDSFTVGVNGRQIGANPPNTVAQYAVENTHGNPTATWTPYSAGTHFSFQTPVSDSAYAAISPAPTGNRGATGGFMRPEKGTGSENLSDYGIAYDLRTDYVVSVDAILPTTDRINISSLAALGDSIVSTGGLAVFFRADYSNSTHGAIDLFANGATYRVLNKGLLGVNDKNWHNLAVRFNQDEKKLWILVDGRLVGMGGAAAPIDLTYDYVGTSLAGAPLANHNYSNNVVAIGGAQSSPNDHPWLDNFQVGSPVKAEPCTMFLDTFNTGGATGINHGLGWPRQLGTIVGSNGIGYVDLTGTAGTATIVNDQLFLNHTSGSQGAKTIGLNHNFSNLAGSAYAAEASFLFNSTANENSWNAIRLDEELRNEVVGADLEFLARRTGWWYVYANGVAIAGSDMPGYEALTASLEYDVRLLIDETGPTSLYSVIVDGTTLVDRESFVPHASGNRYLALKHFGYGSADGYGFDNFAVIPEPSAVLLLGLGMVAMLPFRRRRRMG